MRQLLILLGAPGSGKGTQAKMVFERFGYPQVSTGDILRDAIRRDTHLGREAKAAVNSGRLVPDEVVIGIIEERLNQPDCASGCSLDGFPRTVEQAEALEKLAADFQPRVLFFEVPAEVLVRRLTGRRNCQACGAICNVYFTPPVKEDVCDRCGGALVRREDDAEEIVRRRLAVYEEHTAPLAGFYRERGQLVAVDGNAPMGEIFETVVRAIRSDAD